MFGVANTHTFNQDWFVFTAAGTSVGGFFLPRFRADVSVSRKWLQARRLVTTVGGGYHVAKDAHRDYSVAAGASTYFPAPVIVEGGVTWNNSTPGGVVSRYQFLAVTQGRERERYIIVRVAGGHEAYQLIAPSLAHRGLRQPQRVPRPCASGSTPIGASPLAQRSTRTRRTRDARSRSVSSNSSEPDLGRGSGAIPRLRRSPGGSRRSRGAACTARRIQPHRAFLRLTSSRARFVVAAMLSLPLCLGWIYANPWIVAWWIVVIERSRRCARAAG